MKTKRHFSRYSSTRKRTLSENVRRMHHFLIAFSFGIAILAISLNLWSNAHQASQAYILRELHAEQENLKNESRKLDHLILESQSLESLELSSENTPLHQEEAPLFLQERNYAQIISE